MIEDFARWFSALSLPQQAVASVFAVLFFAFLAVLADRR